MNNKILKNLIALLIIPIFNTGAYASSVEMADVMRANGKIYVVVSVLAIIFLGLISYLLMLDRKLSRIEKEIKENNKTIN